MQKLPYCHFTYPLNVFAYLLPHEVGRVDYLHYGLFEAGEISVTRAQQRSTDLLISRLPAPPARVLDVGIGLGTTLAQLNDLGYECLGIGPDKLQIDIAVDRYGDGINVECVNLERFANTGESFDVVFFQESSQYIDSSELFVKVDEVLKRGGLVVVLDEFALKPLSERVALHSLRNFLDAAAARSFRLLEALDLTSAAASSVDWSMDRILSWRKRICDDLDLKLEQIDELIFSGNRYLARYSDGTYGYRLLVFEH